MELIKTCLWVFPCVCGVLLMGVCTFGPAVAGIGNGNDRRG